jgi:hypothetical protein
VRVKYRRHVRHCRFHLQHVKHIGHQPKRDAGVQPRTVPQPVALEPEVAAVHPGVGVQEQEVRGRLGRA